jgi:hypothetical protein
VRRHIVAALAFAALIGAHDSEAGPRAMRFLAPSGPGRSGCTPTIQGSATSSASWTWSHTVGMTGTATDNAGAGPPGSCSASGAMRIQVSATTTAQYSVFQSNTPLCAGGSSNISWGFWIKATTSQTVDMCQNDNVHNVQCFTCSATANTWVFCHADNKTWGTSANIFLIGNDTPDNGGASRSALDAQIYAPRCLVGSSISP